MAIEFGKLEMVDRTFTREKGVARGQNYDGIKYRRWESKKGRKEAEAEGKPFTPNILEQFVVSNTAFDKLELAKYACVQYKTENDVLLVVLEEVEGAQPEAKFLRQSYEKNEQGERVAQNKSKFFSNVFLSEDLIKKGVLEGGTFGTQYIALEDVTSEISGLPKHVKAIYKMIVDETAGKEEEVDGEDEAAVAAEAGASNDQAGAGY